MSKDEQEQRLLEILNSDELPEADQEVAAEDAIKNAFPHLDEGAQKTMARVMMSNLPTPEEIERAEKIAQHNAVVDSRREENLRRRKERRQAQGNHRKKRRRKK